MIMDRVLRNPRRATTSSYNNAAHRKSLRRKPIPSSVRKPRKLTWSRLKPSYSCQLSNNILTKVTEVDHGLNHIINEEEDMDLDVDTAYDSHAATEEEGTASIMPPAALSKPTVAEFLHIEVIVAVIFQAYFVSWHRCKDEAFFLAMKSLRLVNRTCARVGTPFLFDTVTQNCHKPLDEWAIHKDPDCYNNVGKYVRNYRLVGALEPGRQVDFSDPTAHAWPNAWPLTGTLETWLPKTLNSFSRLTSILLCPTISDALDYLHLLARLKLPSLRKLELQMYYCHLPHFACDLVPEDWTTLMQFFACLTSFTTAGGIRSIAYASATHYEQAAFDLMDLVETMTLSATSLQHYGISEGYGPPWPSLRFAPTPFASLTQLTWLRSFAIAQVGISARFLLQILKANTNLEEISLSNVELIAGDWYQILAHLTTIPQLRIVKLKKLAYHFPEGSYVVSPFPAALVEGDQFGPFETLQAKDRAAWALFYIEHILAKGPELQLVTDEVPMLGCPGTTARCAGVDMAPNAVVRCEKTMAMYWQDEQRQCYTDGGDFGGTTSLPWRCRRHWNQTLHLSAWPLEIGFQRVVQSRPQKRDKTGNRDENKRQCTLAELFRAVYEYRYPNRYSLPNVRAPL